MQGCGRGSTVRWWGCSEGMPSCTWESTGTDGKSLEEVKHRYSSLFKALGLQVFEAQEMLGKH